ncbi:MAG: hypothetical protein WKG52_00365 [Variovorax sp.]
MRIFDSHHDLWDLPKHYYPWLTDKVEPKPGDYAEIRCDYLLDDFTLHVHNSAVVHSVPCGAGMDPLRGATWLELQAAVSDCLEDERDRLSYRNAARLAGRVSPAVATTHKNLS